MKLAILVFLAPLAFAASDPVQIGTYSAAAVVHDTVAFELLEGGKAVVTADYFDPDGRKKKKPTRKIRGSWSFREPFLTISFGPHKDKLRKEDCSQLAPCFKFETSYGKKLSPLNVPYGFGIRTKE